VNVFIGEPNSGKSNVLEALTLLSKEGIAKVRELARVQQPADLFFDREVERELEVAAEPGIILRMKFQNGNFVVSGSISGEQMKATLDQSANFALKSGDISNTSVRCYHYRALNKGDWINTHYGHLLPPYGTNLPALLYTNKVLRDSISAFFKSKGFRLELRPQDNEILMSKEVDDVLYSFPFESISETMKRIVFYKAALESNENAVLIFDEPEANTFPLFTKYLAERIALDATNQFFFSTHNPYVLMNIIEKTPQAELAVYATRMRNYRTELHRFTPENCEEALDLGMDLFLNLDRFFPE
jgi:AAA15 family ATPase/GTPase